MKLVLIFIVGACLALAPGLATAQSGAASPGGSITALGYGFGGVGAASGRGGSEATMHFGGGFEALVLDAIGVGAELGYLAPFDEVGGGIGIISVNGAYHFFPGQSRKARPFVTGGYSLAFRDGHENLWNFGGGVDYWVKPKMALRFEFRDHVWMGSGNSSALHFWGGRFGVVFR